MGLLVGPAGPQALSFGYGWHGGWSTLPFGKGHQWLAERAALCRWYLLPREAYGRVICGLLLAKSFFQCTNTQTSFFL